MPHAHAFQHTKSNIMVYCQRARVKLRKARRRSGVGKWLFSQCSRATARPLYFCDTHFALTSARLDVRHTNTHTRMHTMCISVCCVGCWCCAMADLLAILVLLWLSTSCSVLCVCVCSIAPYRHMCVCCACGFWH